MRGRKLERDEAVDEYLICQLRLSEFLHLFRIFKDVSSGEYEPTIQLPYDDISGTVRSATLGWFVSLIDRQPSALNIFDVWLALFPDEANDIERVWETIEPLEQTLVDFRNNVSFHANKDLGHYIRVRQQFNSHKREITEAMQQFVGLAAKLIKKQETLEWFNDLATRRLQLAAPGANVEELKTYFILNKTEFPTRR